MESQNVERTQCALLCFSTILKDGTLIWISYACKAIDSFVINYGMQLNLLCCTLLMITTVTRELNGTESNMDLWILSRLAGAIDSCNNGFEIYDFTIPTIGSVCYSFWIYDLCDVYLECLKPVFQSGTEAAKESARQTLFTCLYNGLKLISPFMPFISEELFQRLPRADTSLLSICVSDYPELSNSPWKNDPLEKEVEFVQKAAKVIRAARQYSK